MSYYSESALGTGRMLDDGAPLRQKPFNERTLLEAIRSVLREAA